MSLQWDVPAGPGRWSINVLVVIAILAPLFGETSALASDAVRAVSPLRVADDGRSGNAAVKLTLDMAELHQLATQRQVVMTDFALAPRGRGLPIETVELALSRIDVVTPATRFVLGSLDGPDRPLVAPHVVMYHGTVRGAEDSRVFLSMSQHATHGYVQFDGITQLISNGPAGQDHDLLIYDLAAMPRGAIHWRDFVCQTKAPAGGMPQPPARGDLEGVVCRQAKIAVETDKEFTDDLFFGSTAAANAYVVTLIGASSSIFSNQLNVQFSLGLVRLWSKQDPWTAGSTGAQLVEFRDHWNEEMTSVERDLAHYLSGRPLGGGVAYLGVVCSEEFGYGLSANLNGFFPYPLQDNSSQNWDVFVVAHELGHNFGTVHTHDFCPPLDECAPEGFFGECQDTVTCTDSGTIMSYCHLCEGGMANIVLQFHPAVVDMMLDYLDTVTFCDLTCTEEPQPPVQVIAATGQFVDVNEQITLLQPPFTNGLGQVGFTGFLTSGDVFVWVDSGVAWRNSFDAGNELSGSTATMGINDAGEWMYNPTINDNDGIYTNVDGPPHVLLQAGDASPTERDEYITFTSRLQMLPDSTMFFVSGLNPDPDGTGTTERIFYRVDRPEKPEDEEPVFTKVFKAGDKVADDIVLRTRTGVGFDFHISDNGEHHIHRLQEEAPAPFDFVYVDNAVAAYRGNPAGDGTNWNLFRTVSINNHGNYIFGGSTTGGPVGQQNFLAVNGQIAIRSGSTIDGVQIASGATVNAASLNNNDEVAFVWIWGTVMEPQGTLFVGPANDLSSSEAVLSVGDELDLNGDGKIDTIVKRINATTLAGPTLDFSDHPWLFVSADLATVFDDTELTPYTAIVRVSLGKEPKPEPTCPADCGNQDGVVNVSDLLAMLNSWGQSGPCDLNGDGVINVSDLLILLSQWGVCPD